MTKFIVTDVDLYEHKPKSKRIEADTVVDALNKFFVDENGWKQMTLSEESCLYACGKDGERMWTYDYEDTLFIIHQI